MIIYFRYNLTAHINAPIVKQQHYTDQANWL